MALRLEPEGVALIVARRRQRVTGRSRGIAWHGRSCGRCRSRVPLDEPGNTKRVVSDRRTRESYKEVDDHRLRRALARLPSRSSLARRLLLLPAIELLGVLVLETGSLDWQRLEDRGLGERLGHPRFLFMGLAKRSWPEIVVHIPRKIWEVERLP
jgi:hypothetical protein